VRRSPFLYCFYFISLFHLLALVAAWEPAVFYSKPLLMPSLLLALIKSTGRLHGPFVAAAWALAFSTGGDVLLMMEKNAGPLFFYFGLGSFLIAQLFYIRAFLQLGTIRIASTWSLLYALYYLVFIGSLFKAMDLPLLIAVALYGLCLTTMAWNSWRTSGGNLMLSNLGVAGAILFVASDSLIAINRFAMPVPSAGFLIMSTYILAQYLIAEGISRKAALSKG